MKIRINHCLFVLILQIFLGSPQGKAQTGSNPIFQNVFTADPAPLVHDGTLYVYVGHDEAKDGEMFTMTEWLCYSTTDVKNWVYHGPVMKPSDFKWASGDAWAAQVVEKNGKFYLYVTVTGKNQYSGRCVGIGVSDSPTGPFIDARGTPLVYDATTPSSNPWDDIDPTVFIDDDGTAYLAWGNPTCYFAKLKDNMTEIDGNIKTITPPYYAEGPWFHKRNGVYYLTYPAFVPPAGSEQICYATADNINGPWTYQGILTGTAKNSFTIHPGIVEYKSQWYLFYHNATLTINGQGPALGRRSVCVEHLCYNADGTMKPVTQTTLGVTTISPCLPDVPKSPFHGAPLAIPGRIEAEDYDIGGEGVSFHDSDPGINQGEATYRTDGVDIEETEDEVGSYNIGYTQKGEWLEYTVNVLASENYNISFRIATNDSTKSLHLEMDGKSITPNIKLPDTGGWQEWQNVSVDNVALSKGTHVLRLVSDGDFFNINYLQFDKATIASLNSIFQKEMLNKLTFPNPFTETFTIELNDPFHYQLLDLQGKEIFQGKGTGKKILGNELSKGGYILIVNSSKGVNRSMIIKQ